MTKYKKAEKTIEFGKDSAASGGKRFEVLARDHLGRRQSKEQHRQDFRPYAQQRGMDYMGFGGIAKQWRGLL